MGDTKIEIFTAKFVKFENKTELDNYNMSLMRSEKIAIIDVRINKNQIDRRKYDSILIENIKNPDKLIIGILLKKGMIQTNFINGNRYYRLFEKTGWYSEEELINLNRKRKLKKTLK